MCREGIFFSNELKDFDERTKKNEEIKSKFGGKN